MPHFDATNNFCQQGEEEMRVNINNDVFAGNKCGNEELLS
jgi:hypothetical protein